MPLDFDTLRRVNVERANRWHKGDYREWSRSDWLTGLAEEIFEACAKFFGAAKRLRRYEHGIATANGPATKEECDRALGDEGADIVLYLDLVLAREGIDLGEAIRRKFNATSVKYNFPDQL